MLVRYHKAEQYNSPYEHLYNKPGLDIRARQGRLAGSQSGADVLNCALITIS